MLILAHRGASADAPENTIEAFKEAAAQGADGVELDAMLCRTGEVVVCHDERLDRLAGLSWEVAETPWWKLRRVDVGTRLGFKTARIPLLEEAVDALPSHFVINIELKCPRVDDRGLSEKVGEYVRAAQLGSRVVISSFNFLCLLRLARGSPDLRLGLLIDPDGPYFLQSYLLAPLVATHSVHLPLELCTPRRVGDWQKRKRAVAAWTVDDAQTAARLESMGIAYCITNRPRTIREAHTPPTFNLPKEPR